MKTLFLFSIFFTNTHLQHAGDLLYIELLQHPIDVVHLLNIAIVGCNVTCLAARAGVGGMD